MKKRISILAAVFCCSVLMLTGCGNGKTGGNTTGDGTTESTTNPGTNGMENTTNGTNGTENTTNGAGDMGTDGAGINGTETTSVSGPLGDDDGDGVANAIDDAGDEIEEKLGNDSNTKRD